MSNSQNSPNNGSNSGFSLMTSLGGVIGSNNPSGSGSSASTSTPAARLREGLTAMVSSPSNNSATSSYSKTCSSPSGLAVPLGRASNSFSSSSNYHQQLNQKQQQQQRRRVPAYRTGHQSNGVPPQKHQHPKIFSGISPNYSMDSNDHRGGRDSSADSILKASSFDDCYKQNSTGFHDAFALLSPQNNEGITLQKDVEISGNASSPAREKRRNFLPSSPLRSKNQHSSEHKSKPASPKSAHATVDGDSNNQQQRPISSMPTPVKNRHIGSVSSPPNTPPSTGNPATSAHSNTSIGSTSGSSQIASSKMSSPDKESSPSMFPPPPSGIKSKHLRDENDVHATNAAISTTSTRHASPMATSRMKHTLQKTWKKAKATTKGSIGVGHHGRQRSNGSGPYSEAVNEALKVENDDADRGIGAIVVDTGAIKSTGDSAIESSSSQGGIEVISPASMNSFNSSGGKIGKRLNRLRTRTRSPSPIRDLEGNSLSVDGSKVNTANDESKTSNEFMTNNHAENESETTTPSFFRKSPNIRAMSPARMKKNLKKRLLAIPPSSRHDHPPQSHQPRGEISRSIQSLERSRQRDSPRLPLHPSTEVISNHSEEDDALEDVANLSLVNTSMSFDVDDYETSVLEEDELHADSDAMTEVASNKTGSTSASSIGVDSSSSKNADERTINEKLHPNNIFECDDFVRAMGGANEAALATNYIRTGDSLCRVDKQYDRAIPAYYAGLGAILSRVRRWGLNQRDEGFVGMDTSAPGISGETSNIFHEYFQRIAYSMDMNILLLAMSSILLRAGNSHYHLNHWEVACQDYVSAEFYRSLKFSAFLPRETVRQKSMDEGDRKVALNNGGINHDEWYGVSAVLEGLISNNMASAKSNRQMYEEARAEYTEALRIKQSALQALHGDNSEEGEPTPTGLSTHVKDDDLVSDIATTLHNIGLLRSKCGESKKAEKAFTQSLSLRVKKFGLDDPGVSTTLRALGDLYFNEKRYDDSFRSYKESLRICKLHCGKPDLNAAELYYNIGLIFYSKGPYSKSKVSLMECLRIRREHCGNNNLNTASALYLLGLISSAMGEYDDAINQFEEALAIRRNIIGIKSPNHLLLINVHVALGNVHQLNGDFDSAMDSYSLCLKERSERLGKHHPSVSEVLQLIGVAYISAAEYSKALETLEEVLRIRQSLLGPSMEVAETLDSLGLLYFKLGDTEKAVELSEDSLSVLKSAVGFDHVLVSKVLKNIGDYYQDAEVYDDAIEAYSESIRVKTLWYGRDHTSLSEVLNEMGITRFKKGDYMIARQSFSQALRIMRADKNASNKSLIFPTLTHLGHALYKNGDFKLATETYLESFNIQVSIITGEENLGIQGFSEKLTSIAKRAFAMEENNDFAFLSESLGGIASILRYLGLVYQEQGDIETALAVNKLSLSVRLSQPYKEYSAIALMAETIAMFEFKRANLDNALEYFNQALHAKKSYQGDSTIDVARTVNNLANIHFSLGNLDDAMNLYQDALEIKRLCLGNDSDEVANTLNNIAHVMVTAGKEQEALQAYHNVVRIRQDRYGKNHSSVATTLASMGDVYIKLGKLEIAMTYFEQCIRIQKLNQEHCDERVLENLASIYGKLGEWNKAESSFKEIVQLKRSVQGEDSLEVAKSLDLLAVSYIEQDRCVDSIEHLKEALRIRKACLSGEDGEILASLNKLAFVYKSCEMTTEMMDVKAEFDRIQNLRKK